MIVPENAREAEAVTADSLVPGLGALLGAAQGADLFVLSLPDLSGEIRSRRYLLMKAAAIVRSRSPSSRIAVLFHQPAGGGLFPPGAKELLSEEAAAFVDLLGLDLDDVTTTPETVREAADGLSFARPLLVTAPEVPGAVALLDLAARFSGVDAPVVAAPLTDPAGVPLLDRLGPLLSGDVNRDGRSASARTPEGKTLSVVRLAKGTDLGGVVLVTGADASGLEARGPIVLELDSPSYATAEVFELATGRSRSFDLPKSGTPRLSLTTANGPLAVVLTAREKAPAEATRAATDVSAVRGLTVEEILAKHQVWRAGRDARWTRFTATNRTSYRFRLEGFPTSFELTFEGPFFYERGKGFDWAWQTSYVNGVRWKGKKAPELPLLQPEKVSELPLNLTFNEAYRYELDGDGEAGGIPCWVVRFEPSEGFKAKAINAGKVYIAKSDFSLRRVVARQLNLTGEVQSVDETTDFAEAAAPDGGPPLLLPTTTRGQSILRTFSRTTTLERTTELLEVRLDPADYDSRRAAPSRATRSWSATPTRACGTSRSRRTASASSSRTTRPRASSASAASSTRRRSTTRSPSSASTTSTSTSRRRASSSRASSAGRSSPARTATRTSSGRTSTSAPTSSRTSSAATTPSGPTGKRSTRRRLRPGPSRGT
ncbi:MAG: hypothetical protein IPL90_18405 [Holophagales bacterium]|nr:hypothetical protein [Holophagales bacterium]